MPVPPRRLWCSARKGVPRVSIRPCTTFDASSRQIFDKLALFRRGTTEIEPGLAEKWEISADGTEYTFHLRKGVKFHTTPNFKPTRDFNAENVIFTFMRQFDKEHPFHKVGGANYEYFNSMSMPDLLKEIVKVDPFGGNIFYGVDLK